ncbi:MAG: dihydrolipoyl dehydrogenase [Thermodesulfobacteriota bacterium]
MREFDVVIIGGVPGGYVAAIRAAQLGAEVCLVERDKVGGTCLNRGCIPTKALYASAKALSSARELKKFGIRTGDLSFDIHIAVSRKNNVVKRLVEGVEKLLKAHGVEKVKGEGLVESPGRVRIKKTDGEEAVNARNIIIAAGSEPAMVPAFNIDRKDILTSTEILDLDAIPKSLLIIGGGVIGCEFANIFAEFGSKVTLIELLPTILSSEERQISQLIARKFRGKGIDIHTEASVERIERIEGGIKTVLSDGREFLTEKALVSIGRSLNTRGLGLEGLGIKTEDGHILVDEKMETNIKGIYAVGDVVGGMLLAHVASSEGITAVSNALGKDKRMDYSAIPSVIFTDPEVASVGMKEEEAKEKGIDLKVGRFPYGANGKALCMDEGEGYMQVIADNATDRVIGCSIIGAHATDLIGEVTLAIKAGLKTGDIVETVHAHPTLTEITMEAVEDIHGVAIHKAGRRII